MARTLPSQKTNWQTPLCGPPKLSLAFTPFWSFACRSGRWSPFGATPAMRRTELFWPPNTLRSSFLPRSEFGRTCFSPNMNVLLVPSTEYAGPSCLARQRGRRLRHARPLLRSAPTEYAASTQGDPAMRTARFLPLLLLLAPALADAAAPPPQMDEKTAALHKLVRQLEKDIARARDLDFKDHVVFSVIARPQNAGPGIQGYYDVRKKALFVYDDVKDNYAKGVLVHEMVHALQDQHFGLSKLHAATYDDDAELALAALIEGDAQFTTIELLQKEQPFIARMLDTRLEKSKNLQNAFLYGVGARYVQEMKKKGGWRAVNGRFLFFPPTSTAEILHPGERITPLNLGPGKRLGEFGIIRLFHANEKTRPDCVSAAAGWRGDRVIEDHGGDAWLVAFATPEQASTFRKTLGELRTAEQPKVKRGTEGEAIVWKLNKARRAIVQRGSRVVEVNAPDEKAQHALVDRAFGPPKLEAYSAKDKKMLTFGQLTDRLLDARIVCVGEEHSNELHHLVQLMIIKSLYARDERLGVGMEMFQRIHQKSLDRYVSGAVDEATMLEDSDYKARWGWDWALYKPIVDFCKRNHVPVAALNVSKELRERIRKAVIDKLSDEEKKEVGEIDFGVKKHRAFWFDKFGSMHGHGELSKEEKERYYRAMTLWDGFMANSAVRFLKERKLRR